MTPLIRQLVDIATQAADLVLRSYQTSFEITFKGPNDPVTSADRAANEFICEELSKAFPGWPVVAEESDPLTYLSYREADCVFFVDPIDGTQEFVDHTGEFVVMIGLLQHERAVAGVIHAPVNGQWWAGELGKGSLRSAQGSAAMPIAPSRVSKLSQSHILVSRAHRFGGAMDLIESLGAATLRTLGSAGLKGAMVADGQADAYVAPKRAGKRWDACALDAVVTASGGRVTDAFGQQIDYRRCNLANDRGLVVSNGPLHEGILERLAIPRTS